MQAELHIGRIRLEVDRLPGVSEITAGDGGDPVHLVVADSAGRQFRRDVLQRAVQRRQRRFVEGRPRLHEPEFQLGRCPDDLLCPRDVLVARQLHQDLVAGASVGRDDRFCDTQLVDASPDGLHRLGHGLFADHDFFAGAQAERPVAAADAAEIPTRPAEGDNVPDLAEAGIIQIQDGEPSESFRFHVCEINLLVVEAFCELLGSLVGQDPHRVLGMHPHDEMDAALEIQPQHDPVPGRVDHIYQPRDQQKEQNPFKAKTSGHSLAGGSAAEPISASSRPRRRLRSSRPGA